MPVAEAPLSPVEFTLTYFVASLVAWLTEAMVAKILSSPVDDSVVSMLVTPPVPLMLNVAFALLSVLSPTFKALPLATFTPSVVTSNVYTSFVSFANFDSPSAVNVPLTVSLPVTVSLPLTVKAFWFVDVPTTTPSLSAFNTVLASDSLWLTSLISKPSLPVILPSAVTVPLTVSLPVTATVELDSVKAIFAFVLPMVVDVALSPNVLASLFPCIALYTFVSMLSSCASTVEPAR